jgi:hypothetical protein
MNEKKIACHDYHVFKWQNINIYPILTIIFCSLTPFLADWIMITPICVPIHSMFHCILNELEQIYHGEKG